MLPSKAERHLASGDLFMKGGAFEQAFYIYNSALGNFEKSGDIQGQRLALTKMLAAAEAWRNHEMAEKCRKWLKELKN